MSFTPLYIETNYALNGSTIRIDELIEHAVRNKYGALAIAEERMYGAIKFYKACRKAGIKPILGLRIIVEGLFPDSKNALLLYAKNDGGYHNLLQLASLYATDNLVSWTQLKQHKDGLVTIVLSDQSELVGHHRNHQDKAIQEFASFLETHTETSYLSLSANDDFNRAMQERFPLVAVPRIQYLDPEDHDVFDVLSRIFQQSSDLLGDAIDRHFPSPIEVKRRFAAYPEAISNTNRIADMCDVVIDFDTTHLPSYILDKTVSAKDYLRALALKGLEKRLNGRKVDRKAYYERLEYELSVIDQMGYNDYFLIVWDFVKYAKQNGYLVGPGRGSAAASLVSYCLGITNVDSLEFNLVFERFLNPERITLPDIDMDLPDDKRDEIITYVRDFYGADRVSSICTFGTFLSRSAIRDTARMLDIDGVLLNEIIKETKSYDSVRDMAEQSDTIANIKRQRPEVAKLLSVAARIEGLHRHVSTHAAGIIITEDAMTRHTAVQPGLLELHQTQYEAKDLEDLGLLKIDFLGLRNLSSIHDIVQLIEDQEGVKLDVYKIPLDDQKTFELLQRVETTGIFQLESKGMRRLIADMQINSFEDIVAVLALFRPGPMDNIPTYLKRRSGEEEVSYPHPILKDILEPTNGIIIYQEQIIQIANLFAGYSLGEADLLRRAVSKKQEDVLQKERSNFLAKAKQKGRDDDTSNEIYDYIVKFANYGFNRAHSVAYAMVSYWLAYLKANYPKYFISILTSSVIGSESNMREYIFEANKLGVAIVAPSVNRSFAEFRPEHDTLRYPLLGIKNVGKNTVRDLLEERANGPFKSFYDFVQRTNGTLNKRVIESLIFAGALDEFGYSKRAMIEQLEEVINFSVYGGFIKQEEFVIKKLNEYPYDMLEAKEKELLGFNLFVNPLNHHRDYIHKHHLPLPADIGEEDVNQERRLVAILSSYRVIKTKAGKEMAFLTLQDEFAKLTGVLFPSAYRTYRNQLENGSVYLFKGKVDQRGQELQIVLSNLHKL